MLKVIGMTLSNLLYYGLQTGRTKTIFFDLPITVKKDVLEIGIVAICKKNKVSLKKYRYAKFILSSDNTAKDKKYFHAIDLGHK